VDGNHVPVQEAHLQQPGVGGHYLSIDDYDEKTGRVHIANQWVRESDKWVKLQALFKNASGQQASEQDGIDLER
jgi:hypothetical protein